MLAKPEHQSRILTSRQNIVVDTRLELSNLFAQAGDRAIVNSLLDTDFYKFPMNQLQREEIDDQRWGTTEVTFGWINRSKDTIKPHEVIDINELREQLESVRQLKFTPAELSYLAGMPINPERTRRMFSGWFIKEIEGFQLPDFNLSQSKDGSLKLEFQGQWQEVTYWEIIAMSIVSEMYYYGLLKNHNISSAKISAIYDSMMSKLEDMANTFRQENELKFAEFGGRRRHSKTWHDIAYSYLESEIPEQIIGTSNVSLSMRSGSSNPIGTNAHELPMVVANLGDDSDRYIKDSQYEVVRRWQAMFPELSLLLADTFGTKQFLDDAPEWVAKSTGSRIDSMEENRAIDMHVDWWKEHSEDPSTKLLVPSDGLTPEKAVQIYRDNVGKVGQLSFGIGTSITNNCNEVCDIPGFQAFSQVVKVIEANGKSAVKISDNPAKATGDPERVSRFKKIFDSNDGVFRTVNV